MDDQASTEFDRRAPTGREGRGADGRALMTTFTLLSMAPPER